MEVRTSDGVIRSLGGTGGRQCVSAGGGHLAVTALYAAAGMLGLDLVPWG
jgi:hypothetical protein